MRKDPWQRGIIRDQNDWIRQGRPIVLGKRFRG